MERTAPGTGLLPLLRRANSPGQGLPALVERPARSGRGRLHREAVHLVQGIYLTGALHVGNDSLGLSTEDS